MLGDVRVLEVSAPATMLAGRILADLGADVLALEPPGGAPGRRMAPFVAAEPGLERSLTWQALNYNKRGITLSLVHPEGLRIFSALAGKFDVIIYATQPSLPNPLEAVELPNPVIRTVIRPFSRTGPKSQYLPSEMVLMAASGAPGLAGEPDRPPLFFPSPQALMEAGAEAAVVTLGALIARDRDGRGQTAEVSNCIAATAPALGRVIAGFSGDQPPVRSRTPGGALSGTVSAPPMYRCRDGFVLLQIVLNGLFADVTTKITRWLITEGELDPKYEDFDWSSCARPPTQPARPTEPLESLISALTRACARMTKTEVTAAARAHGFMAAPIMDMKDVAEFPHYRERGLFASTVIHPNEKTVELPARFAKLDRDPIEIRRPAPLLSQHTVQILRDLGLSADEVQALYIHEVI